MSEISIDARSWEFLEGATPEAATFASLAIRIDGLLVTEVSDKVTRSVRDVIRVSGYPLALWFASNWWRLRWEGQREGIDWELSHVMGSAGGGYVWPNLVFSSDGEQIEVISRTSGTCEWEPVEYLRHGHRFLRASDFERGVAQFIEVVLARLSDAGHMATELCEVWAAVRAERSDQDLAMKRRFEALLGFDPDEAPPVLMDAYLRAAQQFGHETASELAAASTNEAPPDWQALKQALQDADLLTVPEYAKVKAEVAAAVGDTTVPWRRGEAAARAVRVVLGKPQGPLKGGELRSWLGQDPGELASGMFPQATLGLRSSDAGRIRVMPSSTRKTTSRFESARIIADDLLAAGAGDTLLAATRSATARQRLQRAFAAEFLLPLPDLEALGHNPNAEAIEDLAAEYEVSTAMVITRLVNKRRLSRDALFDLWD